MLKSLYKSATHTQISLALCEGATHNIFMNFDHIDFDEGRDYAAPPKCFNCQAKSTNGTWLSEYTTETGEEILLCDECREEEARVERKADELAKLPSCDYRAMIVDQAHSSRELANLLEAHDLYCEACRSTRKTVQDDRLYVQPAAVCCEGRAA